MKPSLYIIAILYMMTTPAQAASVVSCTGVGDCDISYYRSDVPVYTEQNKIQIVERRDPIPPSNRVEFKFDGSSFITTCDGGWTDIPSASATPNRMRCTVDRGIDIMSGTAVTVDMIVYDQDAATYHHITRPSDAYPDLLDTSANAPYCESDTFGRACKWQQQNTNDPILNMQGVPLNNWIVMSRTTVTGLRLGYTIDDMPFEAGQKYCHKDINLNSNIDIGEFWQCLSGTPEHVCPEDQRDCYPPESALCDNGGLDGVRDRCVDTPSCAAPGGYEASRDRCETAPTQSCTTPRPPAIPVCTDVCPTGYTMVAMGLSSVCVASPYCVNGGSLRSDPAPMPGGPSGSSYCDYGSPTCVPAGAPNPQNLQYSDRHNACYPGGSPCPYGDAHTCVVPDGFTEPICSPHECASVEEEGSPMGAHDKKGDGDIDANGECMDNIYIFNGHDERCRSGGVNLGGDDCCKDKSAFFGLFRCREHERQLAELRDQELCVSVGDEYCSKKLRFIGFSICLEKKKTYCCFNSQMAKLINEQGRKQLQTIDWGTAKHPNCRGFTPEEFQSLDFSEDKIDLSQWYNQLQTNSNADIQSKISNKINRFYNDIR